jgi:Flp pilus assembly protein TadD
MIGVQKNLRTGHCAALGVLALTLISGCATTTTASRNKAARIEVQEAVGFTIIEEARVSNEARLDYDEALRYLKQGDLERGIDILNAVVAASPQLAAPRIDLGIAQHLAGDLDAAESSLLQALQTNPGHPIALNELGILYRKSGRFIQARRSYEAALATYPGFHYARRNLAVLCDLYLADLNCALDNYEAYMATVPGDDEASMWIADLRYRMDQGD